MVELQLLHGEVHKEQVLLEVRLYPLKHWLHTELDEQAWQLATLQERHWLLLLLNCKPELQTAHEPLAEHSVQFWTVQVIQVPLEVRLYIVDVQTEQKSGLPHEAQLLTLHKMHAPFKRVYNEEQLVHTLLLEHEVQPIIEQL